MELQMRRLFNEIAGLRKLELYGPRYLELNGQG